MSAAYDFLISRSRAPVSIVTKSYCENFPNYLFLFLSVSKAAPLNFSIELCPNPLTQSTVLISKYSSTSPEWVEIYCTIIITNQNFGQYSLKSRYQNAISPRHCPWKGRQE